MGRLLKAQSIYAVGTNRARHAGGSRGIPSCTIHRLDLITAWA